MKRLIWFPLKLTSPNPVYDYGELVPDYYSFRRKKQLEKSKILLPGLVTGSINFKNNVINYEHKVNKDNNNHIQTIYISDGCSGKDTILTELVLSSDNKDILLELCDESKKIGDNKRKKNKERQWMSS